MACAKEGVPKAWPRQKEVNETSEHAGDPDPSLGRGTDAFSRDKEQTRTVGVGMAEDVPRRPRAE